MSRVALISGHSFAFSRSLPLSFRVDSPSKGLSWTQRPTACQDFAEAKQGSRAAGAERKQGLHSAGLHSAISAGRFRNSGCVYHINSEGIIAQPAYSGLPAPVGVACTGRAPRSKATGLFSIHAAMMANLNSSIGPSAHARTTCIMSAPLAVLQWEGPIGFTVSQAWVVAQGS